MITKISLCNIQLFVQDDLTRLNIFKNEKKILKKRKIKLKDFVLKVFKSNIVLMKWIGLRGI